MKCIIAGSRTITSFDVVNWAVYESGWSMQITEVVCGDSEENVKTASAHRHDVDAAKYLNVDILGALWGIISGVSVKYFPADWDNIQVPGAVIRYRRDGKSYNAKAGPDRNEKMAEYADALILVWTGQSKGSGNMLAQAQKHGLKIYQHIVKDGA